ncbi:MAG: DUF550 domain-containing protein [Clostridia bacterium]|nr:DUF550 domain-containing protein [Clostridia bacterium]
MNRKDGKISDFLRMQHELAVEKGWIGDRTPEHAPFSLLWSIDELGEAIAIIKKKGAAGIMENESVRAHFTEEVADTFMYLFDMMESYGITAEEFTEAYVRKFEKNLGRDWHENNAMYEKCDKKIILFDMEGTIVHEHEALPWTERLLEVLKRTELKLAVMTDLDEAKGKAILTEAGMDADAFDLFISAAHYDEAFRRAAETYGSAMNEIVFCTGSAVGIKIASRCGVLPVAVRTHFKEEFYKKAGAEYVLSDLTELTDILGFAE